MSYDIRIMKGDDPYGEPVESLQVKDVVRAVDTFPPFVEHGITWANQRWEHFPSWEGLMIYLEEQEPGEEEGQGLEGSYGVADACSLCISYGTESDLKGCLALALHIAQAAGAKAWDLQLDRPVSPEDVTAAMERWGRNRGWLKKILGWRRK